MCTKVFVFLGFVGPLSQITEPVNGKGHYGAVFVQPGRNNTAVILKKLTLSVLVYSVFIYISEDKCSCSIQIPIIYVN